jgi:hypothetical protein
VGKRSVQFDHEVRVPVAASITGRSSPRVRLASLPDSDMMLWRWLTELMGRMLDLRRAGESSEN